MICLAFVLCLSCLLLLLSASLVFSCFLSPLLSLFFVLFFLPVLIKRFGLFTSFCFLSYLYFIFFFASLVFFTVILKTKGALSLASNYADSFWVDL